MKQFSFAEQVILKEISQKIIKIDEIFYFERELSNYWTSGRNSSLANVQFTGL